MKYGLNNKILLALLIAFEMIFCFTPIGSIPVGPVVATLSMVPVCIGACTLGIYAGTILGFVFAVCSFIYFTFLFPTLPTAFLFTPFAKFSSFQGNFGSIIICFVPRILAGFIAGVVSQFKLKYKDIFASIAGSFSNTIFVLLFIAIFFSKEYETILDKALFSAFFIIILTNAIPEAIICGVVCPLISSKLKNGK